MSVGEYRLLYEMYHMHILFFERYANAFTRILEPCVHCMVSLSRSLDS